MTNIIKSPTEHTVQLRILPTFTPNHTLYSPNSHYLSERLAKWKPEQKKQPLNHPCQASLGNKPLARYI